MAEDASLDDFLDASGDADGDGAERGEDRRDASERGGNDDSDDRAADDGRDAAIEPEPGDESDRTADGESTTAAPDGAAERALATYAWSPDGGECAACGAAAERRWRDDGRLVCPDCVEW